MDKQYNQFIKFFFAAICVLIIAGIGVQNRAAATEQMNVDSFLSETEEGYCERYCAGNKANAKSFIGYFDFENSEYVNGDVEDGRFVNVTYRLRLNYNDSKIDIWLFLDTKKRIDRFLSLIAPFEQDGERGITSAELLSICAYIDDQGFYIGYPASLKVAQVSAFGDGSGLHMTIR